MEITASLLAWLLRKDNPPVRFFVLRDLLGRPMDDPEVGQARAAIMDYAPVRSILDRLSAPGYWKQADEERVRRHIVWVLLLAELGAAPDHPLVRRACEFALETMQQSDGAFPSRHPVYGGLRPCTQGLITEALLRLTVNSDARLERAIEFATSMAYACVYNAGLPCAWGVVKLLRSMAAIPTHRRNPNVLAAIQQGVGFLSRYDLAQADFPHAEAISPEWFRFGFPRGYQTDVLETLETFARLGCPPDPRLEAAVDLVRRKRRAGGRWHSEFVSPLARDLGVDREGAPSKWITLRALRVLKWWEK
jgi:hypothetical protein